MTQSLLQGKLSITIQPHFLKSRTRLAKQRSPIEDSWDSRPHLRLGFSGLFLQPDEPLGDGVSEA